MDSKELRILSYFRQNARENLTTASRKISIPISTIYDKLRKMEGGIIQRHTSLLDFSRLGYNLKIQMVIKIPSAHKKDFQHFLECHPRVNSLFAISNAFDFLVEVVLKDLREVASFIEAIEAQGALEHHEFYIVQDIRREQFLSDMHTVDVALAPLSAMTIIR